MIDREFWKGKRVFVTGHTGFKGSWLVILLNRLGARVTGYSLDPPSVPNLFDLAFIKNYCRSLHGDIRDGSRLAEVMVASGSEIIFHLAAQALVHRSYEEPVETFSTNIMGTVNMLEAARKCPSVRAIVNVTTDKCYENEEWPWGYRETDRLGGHDPYASSKACSEILTASFRASFFPEAQYGKQHHVAAATARAGNVIGGGDWARGRLVPDCIRAYLAKERVVVRNPDAVRPWQHVLEPLSGYLMLAEAVFRSGSAFAEAWNFGPNEEDSKSVEWILGRIAMTFHEFPGYEPANSAGRKESSYLRLDSSKSRQRLGWKPRWSVEKAIEATWQWVDSYVRSPEKAREVCESQVTEYLEWK
jgi:CDP-glucose 4,6-dehydratase